NADCAHAKSIARKVNTPDNWLALKKATKRAKRAFFEGKISEIADKTKRPWDLMHWTGPRKLPPSEALRFEGEACDHPDKLWNALHNTFNSAEGRPHNVDRFRDSMPVRDERPWGSFSMAEMTEALAPCSGRSAPGPDHLTWSHLKLLMKHEETAELFLWIANACLRTGYWPEEFKISRTVVIPKPGKPSYDSPKMFRPIVLLNTLGKLIEKLIANRLQYSAAAEGILHPCQFGGVRQNSTEDAGVFLTHIVRAGWAKGKVTSVLAFDLAQYFPSLNHEVIVSLLEGMGFAAQVVDFFKSYLTGRKTRYSWDNDLSPEFDTDVGVGQGSALSPILSALYLAPLLWQFDQEAKGALLMSYVDDGTILVQSPTWDENSALLRQAYAVVHELTAALGLVLEHSKSEVFHFSRRNGDANPPIDLGFAPFTGDNPLRPKPLWRYLGFFFDRHLSFQEHAKRYANKALTTVRAMYSLGNSVRGLSPKNKRLLYRSCVVPVATYGTRLWNFEGSRNKGPSKALKSMQAAAARWITGAFRTSPSGAVETIAGLPPIHFHIRKLVERSHTCIRTLAESHTARLLIWGDHPMSMARLSHQEQARICSPISEAWANADLCSQDL